MLWKLFGAIASKHWKAATVNTPPPPHTKTPLADLTQRSAVEIGPVPLILAQGDGSLIKNIPGRHVVTAVGTLAYMGHTFYRVYLSQGEGAFLHIATHDSKPNEILELRLYQPYHEIDPNYQCTADEAPGMLVTDPNLIAPEGTEFERIWTSWLKNDPDPMVGGIIGCPAVNGKSEDIDPVTKTDENPDGSPYEYYRTWVDTPQRIVPVDTTERLLDQEGTTTVLTHQMMHYVRLLMASTEGVATVEYLLMSAVNSPDGASVNYWLGMDVKVSDLTIYSPPAVA